MGGFWKMRWMTIGSTVDGTPEGCRATLKDACGYGCEDLPSAIYTLVPDVRMFQSCWTCTGFGQYCINVIIFEVLIVKSTDSTVYPGTIMKSKRLEFRHREIRVVSHEAGGALARGGEPGAARRAAEARRGEACDGSLARL
ncbi:hypothetical protein U9M48_039092 [Paspalum notatum var. saurae]|uniref:Uncharacterized protein n=1 Tax=Paspalum notatum var. saurae TaxID=547442 RepID=A0AAQ3XB20_PASNO